MSPRENCHNCGLENGKKESNSIILSREYGNEKCYYCHDCKTSLGTHNNSKQLDIIRNKRYSDFTKSALQYFRYTFGQ